MVRYGRSGAIKLQHGDVAGDGVLAGGRHSTTAAVIAVPRRANGNSICTEAPARGWRAARKAMRSAGVGRAALTRD